MRFKVKRASFSSHEAGQYILVLRSICVGINHLIRRLLVGDVFIIMSKLRKLFLDEPTVTMAARHYFEVVGALNRNARALMISDPSYANKYISPYLAKSLTKQTRREILLFHHAYLATRVNKSFYYEIMKRGPILWDETINGNIFAISIAFNHQHHHEGDLTLAFQVNQVAVYEIGFSIVPGKAIGSAAERVLLIGAVQGRPGEFNAIKVGTKACRDIAPPHLLLSALLSIARVLAIDVVAGVSNEQQLSKNTKSGAFFDYDAFWGTCLLIKNCAGFYEGPIPLPEKPIKQTKSKHRGKVRSKRRQRKEISEHVAATFARNFMKEQADRNAASAGRCRSA